MKHIFYYIRLLLFITYLIILFLMIEVISKITNYELIFYLLNIFYISFIIMTILSKKNIFKENIFFNFFNCCLPIYIIIIYNTVLQNNILSIIGNPFYFINNFIIIGFSLIGIITFGFLLYLE